MIKTIVTSVVTTLATLFVVFLIGQVAPCGKQSCGKNYSKCSAFSGDEEMMHHMMFEMKSDSCHEKSSCGKGGKCSGGSCSKSSKCTKGASCKGKSCHGGTCSGKACKGGKCTKGSCKDGASCKSKSSCSHHKTEDGEEVVIKKVITVEVEDEK